MKTMLAALAAILLAVLAGQSPALAQADDAAFVRTMRQFGDITGGQQTRGGQVMDKVLAFGRNAAGEIIVTAMLVLPPGADWVDPPAGAVGADADPHLHPRRQQRAGPGRPRLCPADRPSRLHRRRVGRGRR